ncbi:hypothetical protein [uncultured Nostoc sp.]|uniref:hypothetical protein n=1 Tax=uncultured Nostoc sp. TaxID=340711 RepID=UPI0035C9EA88
MLKASQSDHSAIGVSSLDFGAVPRFAKFVLALLKLADLDEHHYQVARHIYKI